MSKILIFGLSILTVFLISSLIGEVFAVTSNDKSTNDYPVKIEIIMDKDNIEYGEPINFHLNFQPEVPNTPIRITVSSDNFSLDPYHLKIVPKDSQSEHTIIGGAEWRALDYNDGYYSKGVFQFSLFPQNIPTGEYHVKVVFGGDPILGMQNTRFYLNNNENSIGNQYIKKYFPTVLDIGTSFKLRNDTRIGFYQYDNDPCVFSCKVAVHQEYRGFEENGPLSDGYSLHLLEFKTPEDARHYASAYSELNYNGKLGGEHLIYQLGDDPTPCFSFPVAEYPANEGEHGSEKCWYGRFVVMVPYIKNHGLGEALYNKIKLNYDKINSNPTKLTNSKQPTTSNNSKKIASFVDPTKDPQFYVNRYNNEPKYKEWFDKNYGLKYKSIYEAVGLSEPTKTTALTNKEIDEKTLDAKKVADVKKALEAKKIADKKISDAKKAEKIKLAKERAAAKKAKK